MGDHPLRVIGGLTCLAAVVVAAITARCGMPEPSGRTRFISEVLAVWWRRGPDRRTGLAFWGSALATLLLVAGSVVFAADAVDRGGTDRAASVATSLCLLAVAVIPLRTVPDVAAARGFDFGHPIAAAAFYLAALILGAAGLSSAGSVGYALSIAHLATSSVLIGLSIHASCREYPPCITVWPPIGTRILLDLRAESRARRVRWFQWPATCAVGLALSIGGLDF